MPVALAWSEQVADIAIGDWDVLMHAVKARLRLTVGERLPAGAEPVRSSVLECVLALDQLQATLQHALGRSQQLALELFDTQTVLAQVRRELAGTQAGERQARYLALHDGLTTLPNRCFFREHLDQALAQFAACGVSFAVLYIDLDGFKPINDKHGHDVGDTLLKIIATRLARTVRGEDAMSRLGGDEFACLRGGSPSRAQLGELAGKLFDAVAMPVTIGRCTLSVRPSIGIALCPGHGITAATLLRSADAAMYCAKRQRSSPAFGDRCLAG